MKTVYLIIETLSVVVFLTVHPVKAQTAVITPVSTLTFIQVDNPQVDEQSQVRRVVIPQANGPDKLVVDEVTSPSDGITQKYYSIQFVVNGKTLTSHKIVDPMITGLSSESVIRMVGPMPVGYLFFYREKAFNHYRVIVMGDAPRNRFMTTFDMGLDPSAALLNEVCDRYEFTNGNDGSKGDLAFFSRLGHPVVYGFDSYIQRLTGTDYYTSRFQGYRPSPALYEAYRKQLEAEVNKPDQDPLILYLAHMELHRIPDSHIQTYAKTHAKLEKMEAAQALAGEAFQPRCPVIDAGTEPLGLSPFTYDQMVNSSEDDNGKEYKTYHLGPSGEAKLKSNATKDWKEAMVDISHYVNSIKRPKFTEAERNLGPLSSSGFYRITSKTDEGPDAINFPKLLLTDLRSGETSEIPVPDWGDSAGLGRWDPKRDLYYFFVLADPEEGNNLWQFDPVGKQLKKIGSHAAMGDIFFDPDGRWLIWEDWAGPKYGNWGTSGFNAFDEDKDVSYRLSHGLEEKIFTGWE